MIPFSVTLSFDATRSRALDAFPRANETCFIQPPDPPVLGKERACKFPLPRLERIGEGGKGSSDPCRGAWSQATTLKALGRTRNFAGNSPRTSPSASTDRRRLASMCTELALT